MKKLLRFLVILAIVAVMVVSVFAIDTIDTSSLVKVYENTFDTVKDIADFTMYRGTWAVYQGKLYLAAYTDIQSYILYGGNADLVALEDYVVDVDMYNVQTQGGVVVRSDYANVTGGTDDGFKGYLMFISNDGTRGGIGAGKADGKWLDGNIEVSTAVLQPGMDIHLQAAVKGNLIQFTITELSSGKLLWRWCESNDLWNSGTFGFRLRGKPTNAGLNNLNTTAFDNLVVSTFAAEDEPISSGTCGENATWSLDNSGTLTISGSGKMYDYSFSEPTPWADYIGDIKEVVINSGITTIGSFAFRNCDVMTSVSIPNGVETIGDYAFYICNSLKSVTIPDSVTELGYRSFGVCSSMESIYIGDGVKAIGDGAFNGCAALTEFTVSPENTAYRADEYGVLFDYDKTELLQYPLANSRDFYAIPATVNVVCDYAFVNANNLKNITIPNGVLTLGNGVFEECLALETIDIPASVSSIGKAFSEGSVSLTAINVASDNAHYVSVDGVLFNKDMTTLIQYPTGNTAKSYVIPSSVNTVSSWAFAKCPYIESISIPESVETIEHAVFYSCDLLKSLELPRSLKSFNASLTLDQCDSLEKVTFLSKYTEIFETWFDYQPEFTVYGYAGSTAETFTSENNIAFIPLEAKNVVVYIDYNTGNNANSGLAPDTPKMSFGIADGNGAIGLLQDGGTLVVVGKAYIGVDYTLPRANAPITITSVYDGVDYKNSEPATNPACAFKMGSGKTLTIQSDVTFDNIIIFQEGQANKFVVKSGATLTFTESVVCMTKQDYYFDIVVEEGGKAIINGGIFTNVSGDGEIIVGERATVQNPIKKPYIPGDVDGDSNITIRDAARILQYKAGWDVEINLDASDVDGDESVTIRDAARILQYKAGWDVTLVRVPQNPRSVVKLTVDSSTATVDGEAVRLDAAPVIIDGEMLMPVRFLAESVGADNIKWDSATRTATLEKDITTLKLTLESTTAYVNENAVTIPVAPRILNDRTMLPVRFVAETFGATYVYNTSTKTATIYVP